MLLYPLPALLNPFPGTFPGTKNEGIPPSSPFSALMTSFPDIAFTSEEANGCINQEAIGAINEAAIRTIIASRNPPFCFSISCFTVSVAPSINRPDFSSDSTTLIVSSISSFEMKKMNPIPVITAPFPLTFLSNLSKADEVTLVVTLVTLVL